MDQIATWPKYSFHSVAASCSTQQPNRTLNSTEAKAQYWIQSSKGSHFNMATLSRVKAEDSQLRALLVKMHGHDRHHQGDCEHFHPEFITQPLKQEFIWTYWPDPLAGRDRQWSERALLAQKQTKKKLWDSKTDAEDS